MAIPTISVSIRAAPGTPPARLNASVGAAIGGVDRDLAFTFQTMTETLSTYYVRERLLALLSGFFGGLALLMAALGLYGITAYSVSQRRGEIGIRMALGAASGGIVRLVLSRLSLLVGVGVLIGAGLGFWASRFVASLLYGIEPRDPVTLLGAAAALAAVAALAGGLPAWRASRLDPAIVLRES